MTTVMTLAYGDTGINYLIVPTKKTFLRSRHCVVKLYSFYLLRSFLDKSFIKFVCYACF